MKFVPLISCDPRITITRMKFPAALVFTLTMFFANSDSVNAQTQEPLEFEVAVVKPADPQSSIQSSTNISKERFSATGTLRGFIQMAYNLQEFQIIGGPKWATSDRFAVDARPAHASRREEMMLMLQALLTKRFGLKMHQETKLSSVYALARSRGNLSMKEVKDGILTMSAGRGRLTGIMSPADLARFLVPTLGRTVIDQTNLKGMYEVKLEWTPDVDAAPGETSRGPSIFTAIQEQLGLRLESTKAQVQFLVVDHAELPEGN